ncbi:YhfT family protein [Streptomyces sp. NPDC057638]|uniref:YhfT family protein n=1 Tax=Streptomyces sp. NPDC057638 TaxID=3346190 RepID=UPI0036D001D2
MSGNPAVGGADLSFSLSQQLTVIAVCALTALIAHLALAVFNDGVRPFLLDFIQGRSTRGATTAVSFGLSAGFIFGLGAPMALSTGVLNPWLLFLPTDVLGLLAPKRWLAPLLGAAWGAVVVFGLDGATTVAGRLPVDFLAALREMATPILFLFTLFPALAITRQFGRARGALAAVVQLALVLATMKLWPEVFPGAIAMAVGVLALIGFAAARDMGRRRADRAERAAVGVRAAAGVRAAQEVREIPVGPGVAGNQGDETVRGAGTAGGSPADASPGADGSGAEGSATANLGKANLRDENLGKANPGKANLGDGNPAKANPGRPGSRTAAGKPSARRQGDPAAEELGRRAPGPAVVAAGGGDPMASLFATSATRLRARLPLLMLLGAGVCLLAQTRAFGGGEATSFLIAQGEYGEAAQVDLYRAFGFLPLIATTALASGAYGIAGLTFVYPVGYLLPNPWLAALCGALVLAAEVLALARIGRLLGGLPSVRDCSEQLRGAITDTLGLAILFGSLMAASTMGGGLGILIVGGLYLLNEAMGRVVVRMAAAPAAVVVGGVLLNLLYWLNLFTPVKG